MMDKKMSEVFELPLIHDKESNLIRTSEVHHERDNALFYTSEDGHDDQVCMESDEMEYIVDAVNSHDQLLADLAEYQEKLLPFEVAMDGVSTHDALDALIEAHSRSTDAIKQLLADNEKLKQQVYTNQGATSKLNKQISILLAENEKLQAEVNEWTDKIAELEKRLANAIQELKELTSRVPESEGYKETYSRIDLLVVLAILKEKK